MDGLELSILVIYGCRCPPPPSAGMLQVSAWHNGAEGLDIVTAEVHHPSMSGPAVVPLSPGRTAGACNDPLGHYPGFSGAARVVSEDALPRVEPDAVIAPEAAEFAVRLVLESAEGTLYQADVTPDEVCAALS